MSSCTNMEMERMLHDYELSMLSAEDKQQFELHLYECDHCLSRVREFMNVSRIIRTDQDVRAIVQDIAVEIDKKKQPSKPARSKILNLLWPETPRFALVRLIPALVLLLIISFPIYKLIDSLRPDYRQTINLFPMRGGEKTVLLSETGGRAVINFVIENAVFDRIYEIQISSEGGEVVYSNKSFSKFNDQGMGSVILPLDSLKRGGYKLSISEAGSDSSKTEAEYYFSVE